ncbi:alpha/beta hydrolase [Pseudonocardiaceae bacterium YIM PH 21723]|nr:alpha/beta hydrolase [Pseudonocardiaceae bacterium YIM PH 21723]
MPLDPTFAEIRDFRVETGFKPLYTMTIDEARRADAKMAPGRWKWHEHPEDVFDLSFDGQAGERSIRIYRPQSAEPLPVLFYFYGGGFVAGSLRTSDSICRALAAMTPCIVASVDYRLAPEHPFPAALDDCYAAVKWVAEHGSEFGADSRRLAVAGDSSGGNLAASTALMSRDDDGPRISAQVLVYPPLRNPPPGGDAPTRSMRKNIDPMFFNARLNAWYWNYYLAESADGDSPYASPLAADDHGGLPPAMIMSAEYCPLLDENKAYGAELTRAGVPVEFHRYDGLPHGFLQVAALHDRARDAFSLIAGFLRKRWAEQPDG